MLPLRDTIPTGRTPVVTYVFIAVNVLAYFLWQDGFSLDGRKDAQAYAAAMFMHGGLLHLGTNVLFLWIFGKSVEDSLGRLRFTVFYLLGGIAATALYVLIHADATLPTLGASGAIAAVLSGYALLFVRAKVVTVILFPFFFTVVELPALLVLGAWFLLQALSAALDPADGVVYFAYIGGVVFGLATIRLFASKQRTPRQNERFAVR